MRILFVWSILICSTTAFGAGVLAGPMPGSSTLRESIIWLQVDTITKVQVAYWPEGQKNLRQVSNPVTTNEKSAYTSKFTLTDLQPGTNYAYEVLLDGVRQVSQHPLHFNTQPLWHWREDPPEFSFALGSCNYINETQYDRPGEPFGGDYQIFDAIAEKSPAFMLWLGDNVYYREVDWNAVSSMYDRYSHTRQLPELQRLLTSTHHYATWDDHDYGSNDADRSFHLREPAATIFNQFWANPTTNLTGQGGITSYFEWHDVSFFLLDNRYFRSANFHKTGELTVLGEAQIEWLMDSLRTNRASFKFIVMGGQFLPSAEVFETYANLAPGERRKLLNRIAAENIPGVIFLTGDRHHSELFKMERNNDYPLHEWTVSPLTAKAFAPIQGEGQYRVDGSLYSERNFGIAKVSGLWDERKLDLRLHDSDGKQVWEYTIQQTELQ